MNSPVFRRRLVVSLLALALLSCGRTNEQDQLEQLLRTVADSKDDSQVIDATRRIAALGDKAAEALPTLIRNLKKDVSDELFEATADAVEGIAAKFRQPLLRTL